MFSLEIWTGLALFAFAAGIVATGCFLALRDQYREFERTRVPSRLEVILVRPEAWEETKARWREMEEARCGFVFTGVLTTLGAIWLVWFGDDLRPGSGASDYFSLLFCAVGLVTAFFGLCAVGAVVQIAGRLVAEPSEPTTGTPLNRVGIAAPLGEGDFAKPREVHAALSGIYDPNGGFVPPKFED